MSDTTNTEMIRLSDALSALRASVTELEARIEEAEKQEPAAWRKGKYLRSNETMADTPEDHDGLTRYGWEPLYTRPIPAPAAAVPAAQAVDVDAICNAYESGVGHRGRPTAKVNPYPKDTAEFYAYAMGAAGKGDAT